MGRWQSIRLVTLRVFKWPSGVGEYSSGVRETEWLVRWRKFGDLDLRTWRLNADLGYRRQRNWTRTRCESPRFEGTGVWKIRLAIACTSRFGRRRPRSVWFIIFRYNLQHAKVPIPIDLRWELGLEYDRVHPPEVLVRAELALPLQLVAEFPPDQFMIYRTEALEETLLGGRRAMI